MEEQRLINWLYWMNITDDEEVEVIFDMFAPKSRRVLNVGCKKDDKKSG